MLTIASRYYGQQASIRSLISLKLVSGPIIGGFFRGNSSIFDFRSEIGHCHVMLRKCAICRQESVLNSRMAARSIFTAEPELGAPA